MANTFTGIVRDLSGKGRATIQGRAIESSDGSTSSGIWSEKMPMAATEKEG